MRARIHASLRALRAVTVITALALLLSTASAWSWFADLLANFRLHFAVLLSACAAIWVFRRDVIWSAIALAFATWAAAPAFSYVSGGAVAAPSGEPLRVLSFNVWKRNADVAAVAAYLEASGAHVVVLQELFGPRLQALQERAPSYPYLYSGAIASGDVVILSKLPFETALASPLADGDSAAAHVRVKYAGRSVSIVGVHLHWPLDPPSAAMRNAELASLARLVRTIDEPTLVLGDFNLTPWSAHFRRLLDDAQLSDCSRDRGLDLTWPSRVQLLGIRIDHCFHSSDWSVADARVGAHLGSDHRPIIIELALVSAAERTASRLQAQRPLRWMM